MPELVRAGALGAMVGWTLGAQCSGRRGFRRIDFFDPIPPRMPASDALEAWLVWSRHLRSGLRAEALGTSLLAHWNYPADESAFGLSNVSRGLSSPLSGSFGNPLSRGSRGIGRALYWGLALHGKPEEAAEYAYYDASIDHDGEGVWAAVAFARALSLASQGETLAEFVRDVTECLPKKSHVMTAINAALKSLDRPDGAREMREELPAKLGLTDPDDAVLTAAWALLGLVHGKLAFEPSLQVCAGCGGSAHASMVVGAVTSAVAGEVPLAWTKPLGEGFVCGHGLRGTDPPTTIEQFVAMIGSDAGLFSMTPEEPAPQPQGTDSAAPVKVARIPSPVSARVKELLESEPNSSSVCANGTIVSVQYLDPPVARTKQTLKLAVSFHNSGEAEAPFMPALRAPKGWEVAHKMSEFRLAAGGTTSFAVVLKPAGDLAQTEQLTVSTGAGEFAFPVFAPQQWYYVGPMPNPEGTGFDRVYPAETNVKLGQVFNGRSNLPVEWTPIGIGGTQVDVEKLFGAGPGTIYFYANVRFAKPGRYRVVAASGVGVIAFVDGKKLFWYHDTHTPVPRAVDPYVGTFESSGASTVMIKTFRNLAPVPEMTVYFLAEDGSLAVPVAFEPVS